MSGIFFPGAQYFFVLFLYALVKINRRWYGGIFKNRLNKKFFGDFIKAVCLYKRFYCKIIAVFQNERKRHIVNLFADCFVVLRKIWGNSVQVGACFCYGVTVTVKGLYVWLKKLCSLFRCFFLKDFINSVRHFDCRLFCKRERKNLVCVIVLFRNKIRKTFCKNSCFSWTCNSLYYNVIR